MKDLKDSIEVITRDHGSFSCVVDQALQKSNPLAGRGIYLVPVDNGVIWGYDSEFYLKEEDESIVRRPDKKIQPTRKSSSNEIDDALLE